MTGAAAPPAFAATSGLRARLTRAPRISDDALAELLDQVAMVLGTGVAPSWAWSSTARVQTDPALATLAQTLAATPPALIAHTTLESRPGSGLRPPRGSQNPGLRALVLCVQLCDTTGAALAGLLEALAHSLRDLGDAERARRGAFAGAKTTAHLLMALPLVSIVLGYAIGANPLGALLGSSAGLIMLTTGLALMAAGWAWMRRLLRAAAPARHPVDPVIIIDVLAQILASGMPLSSGLSHVGEALGAASPDDHETGPGLRRAGDALRLGADPSRALGTLGGDLARIRTSALLSHTTGAHLVPLLQATSRELRRARVREVERAAATLNVRLVVPTGLTILPAFVILGIVPILTDLLTTHFGWT
ncbi:MAG: type II secretion system F family protein [Dermabacter sp.]|nr:type II secretion system F family protein [Dermabacter sp.]